MWMCFVLLVAICGLTSVTGMSDEMKELADMLHSTCMQETGTSEEAVSNARNGDFSEDNKFKCYIKCVMAQMACISEDGEVDVEATVAVIPEDMRDKAEPVIRKCGTQKGSSACENAWLTHKCYYKESPESMSDEMKELADMLHNTCVDETGVDESLIDKVNNEKVFADDDKLKCYIHCLLTQMAVISDDGVIDPEATIAILPEEQQATAGPVIRKCGSKVGANACENAWLTHKCYAEGNPDAYMIP